MQRSARASALPSVEVKFWTADASGQEEIKEFLTNEIAGEPRLIFYASFLNWCNKHVQKLGDPRAKYQNDGAKVEAEALRDTLRLMARYFRGPWKGGIQSGPIVEVHDPKARDIMEGDAKLRTNVFSQGERFEMMAANGERPSSKKMGERFNRWEQAKMAEEERRMAEEEERKLAQQQWKEIKDAMDDVEEEIEVDDTTAAMGGFAISQQQPWKGNLADRTRE